MTWRVRISLVGALSTIDRRQFPHTKQHDSYCGNEELRGQKNHNIRSHGVLSTYAGANLTQSDRIYDLEHCFFLKLRRGGLSIGAIGEAIKTLITTTKTKVALTPKEFMEFFPIKALLA
jgi:hypothetical protein